MVQWSSWLASVATSSPGLPWRFVGDVRRTYCCLSQLRHVRLFRSRMPCSCAGTSSSPRCSESTSHFHDNRQSHDSCAQVHATNKLRSFLPAAGLLHSQLRDATLTIAPGATNRRRETKAAQLTRPTQPATLPQSNNTKDGHVPWKRPQRHSTKTWDDDESACALTRSAQHRSCCLQSSSLSKSSSGFALRFFMTR